MPVLRINSDEVVEHTDRLEKFGGNGLQNAVRNTLNGLAFKAKKSELDKMYSKKGFIKRNKSFLKAFTGVKKVSGNNISSMESSFGVSGSGKDSVKSLEKHESGGSLRRSMIPIDSARVSGQNERLLKKKNRLSQGFSIQKRSTKKGNRKGFYASANNAGPGGVIKHGDTVLRINKITKKRVKAEPIFSQVKGRTVSVKSRWLIRDTGIKASKSIYVDFKRNAEFQLNR